MAVDSAELPSPTRHHLPHRNKKTNKSLFDKELQHIREMCVLLKQLSAAQQKESKLRRQMDYAGLKVIIY